MRFSKNVTLKQYTGGIFQYILTSQFVYSTPENCIRLKNLRLKIQTQKQKKIHYMYLWLLTKKIPHLQKFYPSWKNTSSNIFFKTKAKKYTLEVNILSKNKFDIFYQVLMQIISTQTNSEKQVWSFHQKYVDAIIFSVPLTKNTYLLQMKNTYFPNIPLIFQFSFSNATAFEKLFFLRALKFLSLSSKNPALDASE